MHRTTMMSELPSYFMLIHVDAPSGRTAVNLRPSDTVADLKNRIEDEEWIPQGTTSLICNISFKLSIACTDRQCLTYLNYNLEDGQTFESYGIGEGARINLDYTQSDEAYCIYIQRTEEVFRVWVKASDTIGSLKTRLMKSISSHGPWRGQHHLYYNQQQLEDGYRFSDYNIQENTIIVFRCHSVFLISVTATLERHGGGMAVRLEVTGNETISSLKARLWDGGLIPRSKKIGHN